MSESWQINNLIVRFNSNKMEVTARFYSSLSRWILAMQRITQCIIRVRFQVIWKYTDGACRFWWLEFVFELHLEMWLSCVFEWFSCLVSLNLRKWSLARLSCKCAAAHCRRRFDSWWSLRLLLVELLSS